MSTDDGKKVAAEWVARMRELEGQRDALAVALRPFTEGLYFVTNEHIDNARALLAEVAR